MAVIDELKKKSKISDLKAEEYAKENGLAHQFAQEITGKMAKPEIKMAQLRKLFNSIKLIDNSIKGKNENDKFNNDKIYLIIPEVAYAVGRGVAPKGFYEVIKFFIEKISINKEYKIFVSFLESTIAYARYEEKKNK